jgi:ubiquinone/menaquinone biosynthesis C-methylase UbiE
MKTGTAVTDAISPSATGTIRVQLQCPACTDPISSHNMSCDSCGFTIAQLDGIYRALPPDRVLHFSRFMAEYETVRVQEGRHSSSSDYYLALPFRDLTGRNSWQWSIRAQTFRHFERLILRGITTLNPRGADILDVGAGNAWLSYRLAMKGCQPIAVDLADNHSDGLGAAYHYFSQGIEPFPCFQAEMDHLPFAARQFDAVIFNASFHYSVNYEVTLKEALRCLRRPGYIVIADSPLYRCAESGQQMIEERKANFRDRFGFSSDSLSSKEYLTPEILSDLSKQLSLTWQIVKPWYGLTWALRPLKARVLRKREPAKFYLLWARVER